MPYQLFSYTPKSIFKNTVIVLIAVLILSACGQGNNEDRLRVESLASGSSENPYGVVFATVTPVTLETLTDSEQESSNGVDETSKTASFSVVGSGWSSRRQNAYWVDLLFDNDVRLPNSGYVLFSLQVFRASSGTINVPLLEQIECQEISCSNTLYFVVELGYKPLRLVHADGRAWDIDAPDRPVTPTPTSTASPVPTSEATVTEGTATASPSGDD